MSTKHDLKSPISASTLLPVSFEGFTVYRDPTTGGHWLPQGELKALAEHQLDQELPPLLSINQDTMRASGRFCPEDGHELTEYVFQDSGITIDQCEKCNGIWLDAGELKKLMAYIYENSEELSQADEELSLSERVLYLLYKMTERPPWL